MTADLLRFALEDARSAALRVQLAIEESDMSWRRTLLKAAAATLDRTIRLLELAAEIETE